MEFLKKPPNLLSHLYTKLYAKVFNKDSKQINFVDSRSFNFTIHNFFEPQFLK